jgi:hypothetical protein
MGRPARIHEPDEPKPKPRKHHKPKPVEEPLEVQGLLDL